MNLKDIYSFYLYGLVYVNWEIQMKNADDYAHEELYFHLKKVKWWNK